MRGTCGVSSLTPVTAPCADLPVCERAYLLRGHAGVSTLKPSFDGFMEGVMPRVKFQCTVACVALFGSDFVPIGARTTVKAVWRLAACALFCFQASFPIRAQDNLPPRGSVIELKLLVTDIGPLLSSEVSGKEAFLLLDTGARMTAVDTKFLGLRHKPKGSIRILGGNGVSELPVTPALRIRFGDRVAEMQTLDVDLAALREFCACQVAGILGLDLLRAYRGFHVDFENGMLRLYAKQGEKVRKAS